MGATSRLGTWEDDAAERLVGAVPRAAPIEVQCAILRSMLRQEQILERMAAALESMATAPAKAPVRPPPVPAKG